MSFLKAEWRKLILANYAIDGAVLKKYLPNKTELDYFEGKCFVSLVGFMFQNTKLLGVPIPFHTNFEEVNLRFYVRYNDNGTWKRGAVFIQELVPIPTITFVANTFYKEHYRTVPMKHRWKEEENKLVISYDWKIQGQAQRFEVTANSDAKEISVKSETEFITEHYWGYTRINKNETFEYEVRHPRWKAYSVADYKINVDFGLVYGKDFEFINGLLPTSVMLAEGSEISVENKRRL